jgi:L-asparaginase
VRKVHPTRLDAFASDGAPAGDHTDASQLACALLDRPVATWPRVAIVTSHAGFDGAWVDALVAAGLDGLVVATTGNGTMASTLVQALERAHALGVAIRRVSRCEQGRIDEPDALPAWPVSAAPNAAKARVLLMVELASARQRS